MILNLRYKSLNVAHKVRNIFFSGCPGAHETAMAGTDESVENPALVS